MKIYKHKSISNAYQYSCPACSKESLHFIIEPTDQTFAIRCKFCNIRIELEYIKKSDSFNLVRITYCFDFFPDDCKNIFYYKPDTFVILFIKENKTEIHTKMFDYYSANNPKKINLPILPIISNDDMYKKIKTYMTYL